MMAQQYPTHPSQLQHAPQMGQPGVGVPHPNQHAMQHFNPVYAHPNQMMAATPNQALMQQQQMVMRQRAAQQQAAQAQAAQMGMVNGVGGPMYATAEGRMVQGGFPGGAHGGMQVGPGGQVFAQGVPPQMRLVNTPAGLQQVQIAQAQAQAQHQAQAQAQAQQNAQIHALQSLQMSSAQQQPNVSAQQQPGGQPGQPGQPGPHPSQLPPHHQAALTAQMLAARAARPMVPAGTSILKLHQFSTTVGGFDASVRANDIEYWRAMTDVYFSPSCTMRQSFINKKDSSDTKWVEISREHLARYFKRMFDSKITRMQPVFSYLKETEVSPGLSMLTDAKSSWMYFYMGGTQIIWHGELRAFFNTSTGLFEQLEWTCTRHYTEYLPRETLIETFEPHPATSINPPLPWTADKSEIMLVGPATQSMLQSCVTPHGLPSTVFQVLELSETVSLMRDLVSFQVSNPRHLKPRDALDMYVSRVSQPQQQPPQQPPGANPQQAHLQQQHHLLAAQAHHQQSAAAQAAQQQSLAAAQAAANAQHAAQLAAHSSHPQPHLTGPPLSTPQSLQFSPAPVVVGAPPASAMLVSGPPMMGVGSPGMVVMGSPGMVRQRSQQFGGVGSPMMVGSPGGKRRRGSVEKKEEEKGSPRGGKRVKGV